jgi:hypothetical protein
MNEKEEVELIAKLVSQQIGLVQALSECQNSKNQLSLQFIKILKAIVLKNNGDFVIEKEFFDSADDNDFKLDITTDDEESIVLQFLENEE